MDRRRDDAQRRPLRLRVGRRLAGRGAPVRGPAALDAGHRPDDLAAFEATLDAATLAAITGALPSRRSCWACRSSGRSPRSSWATCSRRSACPRPSSPTPPTSAASRPPTGSPSGRWSTRPTSTSTRAGPRPPPRPPWRWSRRLRGGGRHGEAHRRPARSSSRCATSRRGRLSFGRITVPEVRSGPSNRPHREAWAALAGPRSPRDPTDRAPIGRERSAARRTEPAAPRTASRPRPACPGAPPAGGAPPRPPRRAR